jgi:glutamate synthase (NADPH/NADH) small chain
MDIKERQKIPRQKMPEQTPEERIKNFKEVPFGYSEDLAIKEALRCIQCKKPLCVAGCPVGIKIPEFIKLISEGKFEEAAQKIKEDNNLPAVCGRVCPQEDQCEKVCVLGRKGESVAIGRLERFVADFERETGKIIVPSRPKSTGKKIAIIGSGPSGLTCASDLAQKGHDVTIFEALHEFGGVLIYGIPEFRLPKKILKAEINILEKLGVNMVKNYLIGKTESLDEILARFDAVFLGTGAGLPYFMNIEGENLNGLYSSNEYLTRINLMRAYLFPEYDTPIKVGKSVAVIGGGNTAMDAVRNSLRFKQVEKAYIIYRRSKNEIPARKEELHHAEEEGVEFHFLTNPIRYIGDDNGWVKQVECIKMELGEPDESGRRRPVPIKGSEFLINVDTVVVAIGNGANPLISNTTPGLEVNRWGNIIINEETAETTKKHVFAGGDIVRGGSTVILAMGDGRKASNNIHKILS